MAFDCLVHLHIFSPLINPHVIGTVLDAEMKLAIENGQAKRAVTGIVVMNIILSNKLCLSDESARRALM